MKKLTGIILGAILIACGVLYALSAFGLADVSFSLDGWWTLFIIVPCLNGLLTGKEKLGSLIGLAVGVLLLLAARDVVDYALVWKVMVPAVVVVLGIKLIVKSLAQEKPTAETSRQEVTGVFSEKEENYDGREVTDMKVGAIFGGTNCNLINAKITNNSRLKLTCVFGGIDLKLPENVIVENNTFCLFGGVEDKRAVRNSDAVTLQISGYCIFGGIDIK